MGLVEESHVIPILQWNILRKNIDNICFEMLPLNEFIYHNKLVEKQERCKNLFYLQKMKKINNDVQRVIITDFL